MWAVPCGRAPIKDGGRGRKPGLPAIASEEGSFVIIGPTSLD